MIKDDDRPLTGMKAEGYKYQIMEMLKEISNFALAAPFEGYKKSRHKVDTFVNESKVTLIFS